MNGAEWVVRELQGRGVPFLSVLSGNGLDPLLDAADRAEMRVVDTRNEQAASYIADTYARLTRRIGVCAVSSGVAHVNALAGVVNAYFDGAPLLLITGSSPSGMLGRGVFQDLDQVSLARPVCKYTELVTRAEQIPYALQEALAAALSGRPGPVHLTITTDAFTGDVGEGAVAPASDGHGLAGDAATPAAALVQEAADLLAQARRPLIVAGSGVFYANGGEALETFVERSRIPMVTPIWDRGVVDAANPAFLGVVGAASGEPSLLPEADLVLLAGARVDYRVGYLRTPALSAGTQVIRMSVEPAELRQGVEPDMALLADPASGFARLAEAWQAADYQGHQEWLSEAQERHGEFYQAWSDGPPDALPLSGWQLVEALRPLLDDEVIFLIDGGNIGQWAHMLLCADRYPSHWLTCGASGVVGWGVPGAMGARLAFPERPVLLLSGDGALGFGLPEFESAARQDLPFAALVADDGAWGIVASGQRAAHGRTVASDLGPADYAQAAKGLGAEGVRTATVEETAAAIGQALKGDRPTLVQTSIVGGGPADLRSRGDA